MKTPKTKVCSKCRQEKLKDEFNEQGASKDGLKNYCKICTRECDQKYYKKNRDKIIKYNHRYYKDNHERILKDAHQYRHQNREKVNKSKRRSEQKVVSELKPAYVRKIIREKYKIPLELISEDMIELERETIHLNRKIRSYKNGDK